MIKFFRHIRQRLVSENKLSKYLLYAIGEIILVVIGILIALQINNNNEIRKQEKVELSYLKRLLVDLNKDKDLWLNTYNRRKNQVDIIQNIIAIHYNKQRDTIDYIKLAAKMKTAVMWADINTNQDTFSEMLSSGNLDLIQNDSIKIKLITLNNNYVSIANWDQTSIRSHGIITEEMSKLYDVKDYAPLNPVFAEYTAIKFTNEEIAEAMNSMVVSLSNIISKKSIINNLDMMSDNYHRQLSAFKELERNVNELIELITNEIEHRTND